MDSPASAGFRRWMAQRADLVGAIRLPQRHLQEERRHRGHHRHSRLPQEGRPPLRPRPAVHQYPPHGDRKDRQRRAGDGGGERIPPPTPGHDARPDDP